METCKFNMYVDQLLETHHAGLTDASRKAKKSGYKKPPVSKQGMPMKRKTTALKRRRLADATAAEDQEEIDKYIHEDNPPPDAKRERYPTLKHKLAAAAYKKTLKQKEEKEKTSSGGLGKSVFYGNFE